MHLSPSSHVAGHWSKTTCVVVVAWVVVVVIFVVFVRFRMIGNVVVVLPDTTFPVWVHPDINNTDMINKADAFSMQ